VIIFTKHSLLKLRHRGISKDLVVAALASPDFISDSRCGRAICFKKFRKLYLKVVFKREAGDTVVITQYWVDKIN